MTRRSSGIQRPGRGIAFQAIILTIATGAAQVAVAVMYLLAARADGPSTFGAVVAALGVASTAVGVVDWGTNSYWVREIAGARLSAAQVSRRARTKMLVGAMIVALSTLGYASGLIPSTWLAASAVMFGIMAEQTASVGLRAAGQVDLLGYVVISDRAAALAVMALMLSIDVRGGTALWLSLSFGSIVGATMAVVQTPSDFRIRPLGGLARAPWAGAMSFGLTGMAVTAQALDVTVLAATGGARAAGLYGAVSRWTQPLGLMANAFAQSVIPRVTRATTWRQSWVVVRPAAWLPAVAALSCVAIAPLSPWVVNLLLGDSYRHSAHLLSILALGMVPAILNQVLAVLLQARGHQRSVAVTVGVAVIVQLLLVATTASAGGATSAALAFACSQIGIAVALLSLTVRLIRREGLM